MASKRIQKDDVVVCLTGKDRGKTGTVQKVLGDRAVVSGMNLVTHHVKRDQQRGVEGSLKKKEASVHLSNLAYYDEKSKKPVKIGFKLLSDGSKIRYNKRTKKEVGK